MDSLSRAVGGALGAGKKKGKRKWETKTDVIRITEPGRSAGDWSAHVVSAAAKRNAGLGF